LTFWFSTTISTRRFSARFARLIHDVAQRQDARQAAAGIDHGQAVNLMLAHEAMRGVELVGARARNHPRRHHALERNRFERHALCVCSHADVAIGDDSDEPALAVDDRHASAIVFPHDASGRIQ